MKRWRVFFLMVFLSVAPYPAVAGETSGLISVQLPSGKKLLSEVADTIPQKTRGLMFRKTLAEDRAMLFVYEEDNFYGIWMKNCYIPLDILWLDKEGRVLYVKERALPCRTEDCPIYTPPQKARYILEVHEGLIRREKLNPGSRLLFFSSGPHPKPIRP